jgi:hypothetical protein
MAEEKPCGEHGVRIKRLEDEEKVIWEAIDNLRNRLPNWAVFLIAFLSGGLGWALQWGFTMARIAAAGK